jgi:hypothetical protein
MADEIPPAPSESPDDVTKSETIRITLPPKSEQPVQKRETVRINVPGQPVAPIGTSPKKETTKLPTIASSAGGGETGGPPPPPSTPPKPFVPPPPSPKPPPSAPGVPPPSVKPLGAATPPPKPPSLGARPTVPLKPAPPMTAGPEPVTQKASPKKETARITLPPEGSKPALPKATVKMQQTQPLVGRPQSGIGPAPLTTALPAPPIEDTAINGMAIAALILSLVALAAAYLAFAAANG